MKVKILAKHIYQGIPTLIEFCPLALALKDKGHKHVAVFSEEVYMDDQYYIVHRGLRFISNFDEGKKVRPCTIELTLQ